MMHAGRRHFLYAGLAVAGGALLSACQLPRLPWQAARAPRIGFLASGSPEGRAFLVEGFRQGMREHGYVEGETVEVVYRFSGDHDEMLPVLASELVDLEVRLIVTSGVPASFAARDATTTIPIVLGGVAANPVETGLIESLARPGGNITGMSQMSSQVSGKRLELFKEIIPGLSRVAAFWNPTNPTYGPVWKEFEAAAPPLAIQLQRLEVRVADDFEGAFRTATEQHAQALIMPGDPLTTNRPKPLADLAMRYRLPAMMEYRVFPEAGGLLSLGADIADLYRRSATHVDKILKGANPADLPVEQAAKFDLVINLEAAKAIGLTVPQAVLAQATEVLP